MRQQLRSCAIVVSALLAGAASQPACAAGPVDAETDGPLLAYANLEVEGADGEASWLDGGDGKTRYGGTADGNFKTRPRLSEAGIVWRPKLGWSLDGTIAVIAQDRQQHAVDVSEAFLRYRPLALGRTKLSVRAGLFWPPVSLEHGGPAWAVRDTITPSAINSWIGEEVKVGGAEATASTLVGNHRLSFTAALFGLNDTAGTLLAFRGWALHDEKATAFGFQPLPPLNDFMEYVQAARTRPVIELDNRPGYYLKASWTPPGPLEVQAFHYDNRGDPEAVTGSLQWGWHTRFDNLSAILDVTPGLRLTAQGMSGRTEMGYREGDRLWVDTRFRSAFLLATQRVGVGTVSARAEAFGTRSRGSEMPEEYGEEGWAITAAARRPITRNATVLVEALHVESRRDARDDLGIDEHQAQTVLRGQLRVQFVR